MSREGSEPEAAGGGDRFPWLVALASLAVGLTVFLRSTVVAVHERETLETAERELTEQRDRYLDATLRLRERRRELPTSGDLLMVELDRAGLHPHDEKVRSMAEEPPR